MMQKCTVNNVDMVRLQQALTALTDWAGNGSLQYRLINVVY